MPPHNERAKPDVARSARTAPCGTVLLTIKISRLSLTLRSFIEQKAQIFAGFRVWLEAAGHGEERPLA